jgi:hypothetical protein
MNASKHRTTILALALAACSGRGSPGTAASGGDSTRGGGSTQLASCTKTTCDQLQSATGRGVVGLTPLSAMAMNG